MIPDRSHSAYEELVVGHALSALEPEDEQELLRHLRECAACERSLVEHRETLAHLAHAGEEVEPPPALWAAIRRDIEQSSGAQAFVVSPPPAQRPPQVQGAAPGPTGARVLDLTAARERRPGRVRRAAPWVSAAAAVALVFGLGLGWKLDSDRASRDSRDLRVLVSALEGGPARSVPLTGADGTVDAVAFVGDGTASVVLHDLPVNDADASVYVLWGVAGTAAPRALATFDRSGGEVQVLQDVALTGEGAAVPEVLVITREPGRTAPPVTHQPALATGRLA